MSPRILIAAGGTGGHIYPALATAAALRRLDAGCTVEFVCGEREVEQRIYADAGENPRVMPARTLGSGVFGRAAGAFAVAGNVVRSLSLVRRGRYDAVVGFGGYVCGPVVLAGILLRRPAILHEGNSIPGRTNRWLARWVNVFATHFDVTRTLVAARRIEKVGMPVREFDVPSDSRAARSELGLTGDRPTLLIIGGSQGAKYLNEKLLSVLQQLDADPGTAPWQILWGAGPAHADALQELVQSHAWNHLRIDVRGYIADMGRALAAADGALARAGASTAAELRRAGMPTLFVPYPAAIYDHQTRNARACEEEGWASWLPESAFGGGEALPRVRTFLHALASSGSASRTADGDPTPASERLAGLILAEAARR